MQHHCRRLRLALIAFVVGLLAACGQTDAPRAAEPTGSAVAAQPSSAPAFLSSPFPTTYSPLPPTITPVVLATATPMPAPTLPPEPTLTEVPPAEATAAAATEEVAAQATEVARVPPTPAVPLAEAVRSLGAHTLLFTDPNRFLQLVDVDSGQRVWLTVPGPTHRCNTVNDGGTQSGEWSDDGRYIAVSCDDYEHWSAALFSWSTGELQRVSEFDDAPHEQVDETAGFWSPRGARYLLGGSNWQTNEQRSALVNADTGARQPITLPPFRRGIAWSPDGKAIAVIGRDSEDVPWQLRLIDVQGRARALLDLPQPDRQLALPTPVWTPDGAAVFCLRATAADQVETVRIDVRDGGITAVAPNPIVVQWSPDGQWYLARAYTLSGEPAGAWQLFRADGSRERDLQPNYQHVAWLPDSSGWVGSGVAGDGQTTIMVEGREGGVETIARYPGAALRLVSPDGTLILVNVHEHGPVVLNRQGQELLTLPEGSWAQDWRPLP